MKVIVGGAEVPKRPSKFQNLLAQRRISMAGRDSSVKLNLGAAGYFAIFSIFGIYPPLWLTTANPKDHLGHLQLRRSLQRVILYSTRKS